MKLNLWAVSLSLGATSLVAYLICGLLYFFSPDLVISYFNYLIHSGISLQKVALDLNSFLIGLLEAVLTGWIAGLIFVPIYNYFVDLLKK